MKSGTYCSPRDKTLSSFADLHTRQALIAVTLGPVIFGTRSFELSCIFAVRRVGPDGDGLPWLTSELEEFGRNHHSFVRVYKNDLCSEDLYKWLRKLPVDLGAKDKEALVIHPKLSVYGGAEYLCLYACMTLQKLGYHVNLVSDDYDPTRVQSLFGMGNVLSECSHISLPVTRLRVLNRFLPLQRLLYTWKLARFANSLNKIDVSIVLSTQSSIFAFPGKRLYHFVYEVSDLFCYPMPIAKGAVSRGGRAKRAYFAFLRFVYNAKAGSPSPLWFFVTGQSVLEKLKSMGHENSSFFYPPARMFNLKLPKKKQIVQACRIAPEKRLEFMFEVANKLPEYDFYLIGKNLPEHLASNPGYSDSLFRDKPANVHYSEALIRDRPELLEQSKVYFHTGLERGILLILIEAMSAGCVLVVPEDGVAGEVVRAAGVGYQYRTVQEAVEKLRNAMDGSIPWTPMEISEKAAELGPKGFEDMITRLVKHGPEAAVKTQIYSSITRPR